MEIIEKAYSNQDLIFLLLLGSFFSIVILKAFYNQQFKLLVLSIFSKRNAYKYLREDNVFTERVNIITFCILIINFSLWILKIVKANSTNHFFIILAAVLIFYLSKYLIIRSLGDIFLVKELSRLGIFFSLLFDRVFFILLFPIIVLLYFSIFSTSSHLLVFSICCFFTITFFKIGFLYKTGVNTFGIHPLYIFLYLCILEFFPIILLGKELLY